MDGDFHYDVGGFLTGLGIKSEFVSGVSGNVADAVRRYPGIFPLNEAIGILRFPAGGVDCVLVVVDYHAELEGLDALLILRNFLE